MCDFLLNILIWFFEIIETLIVRCSKKDMTPNELEDILYSNQKKIDEWYDMHVENKTKIEKDNVVDNFESLRHSVIIEENGCGALKMQENYPTEHHVIQIEIDPEDIQTSEATMWKRALTNITTVEFFSFKKPSEDENESLKIPNFIYNYKFKTDVAENAEVSEFNNTLKDLKVKGLSFERKSRKVRESYAEELARKIENSYSRDNEEIDTMSWSKIQVYMPKAIVRPPVLSAAKSEETLSLKNSKAIDSGINLSSELHFRIDNLKKNIEELQFISSCDCKSCRETFTEMKELAHQQENLLKELEALINN
eukprot:NODE_282_length_10822_cov_1.088035.p5 type:complete len:310 gc:universal NODE_282_length_10822_cov_1.088035:3619-2690(-)